jgi:hypothetical protein
MRRRRLMVAEEFFPESVRDQAFADVLLVGF